MRLASCVGAALALGLLKNKNDIEVGVIPELTAAQLAIGNDSQRSAGWLLDVVRGALRETHTLCEHRFGQRAECGSDFPRLEESCKVRSRDP